MVWTFHEEGRGLHWEKDGEDAAARAQEKWKTKEMIYGCCKRGYKDGWYDGGCRGEPGKMEEENPLWRPLNGSSQKKEKPNIVIFKTIAIFAFPSNGPRNYIFMYRGYLLFFCT